VSARRVPPVAVTVGVVVGTVTGGLYAAEVLAEHLSPVGSTPPKPSSLWPHPGRPDRHAGHGTTAVPLPPATTVREVTNKPTALGQLAGALFFFGFCGLGFGWFGVREIVHWEYHPRGTVVVRECHWERQDSKSGRTTYECFGDYTSDAGDLHQGVWFTGQSNHKQGDTVRATVSGPDAGEAELFDPVNAA